MTRKSHSTKPAWRGSCSIAWVSLIMACVLVSCGTKRRALESPDRMPTAVPGTGASVGVSYIDRYKDIAVEEMYRYGIPASIKLAQAILESGNGNSYLATTANNHFGIKCGGAWSGRSVNRPDDTANDCFRVYDNAEASFRDHSQFLLRKRYEKLFSLKKDDYKGWAKGLKDAGYATNPRYPDLLIDLIERYHLYQYDQAEEPKQAIARVEKVEEAIEQKAEETPEIVKEDVKQPVSMQIHEVKSSDTLPAIAEQYDLTVSEIKLLNGLESESVSVGQLLVVSK